MNELNKLTITQALDGLKEGSFTSVELTKACLDEIELYNKHLNAFLVIRSEEALDRKSVV